MHRDEALPFKSFVPNMVLSLEDSDGTVRDAAKGALVDLFGYTSSIRVAENVTNASPIAMRQTAQKQT